MLCLLPTLLSFPVLLYTGHGTVIHKTCWALGCIYSDPEMQAMWGLEFKHTYWM